MELGTRALHWRRVGFAAVRLAAFYAVGVVCLLITLLIVFERPPLAREMALVITLPFIGLFMFAFVILVVARRLGFAILWALLLALWTSMMVTDGFSPWVPRLFLGWSTMALPLFALGALGFQESATRQTSRLRVPRAGLLAAIWLVLAAAAVYYTYPIVEEHFPSSAATGIADAVWRAIWLSVPFVIPFIEFARAWTGTASQSSAQAAA